MLLGCWRVFVEGVRNELDACVFYGPKPTLQIVKTDLIFPSESQCFAKEAAWVKVAADSANRILSEKSPENLKGTSTDE